VDDAVGPVRPLRADAQRNRAHILTVAARIFAEEGLSVPVHEIARRAGVGTGTVSRHFPSKEDLFAAVIVEQMRGLIESADALGPRMSPSEQFFAFFGLLVREGSAHQGLAEALAGAGYDVETVGAAAGWDVSGRLQALLVAAQDDGGVRGDVTYADVKALMSACLARAQNRDGLDRMISVVVAGLRAP
jgi:AcrR family transcriptional regulator